MNFPSGSDFFDQLILDMLKDGKISVDEGIKLLSTLDGSPHTDGPLNFIDIKTRFFYGMNLILCISLIVEC
jgi:hypothetical protein